MAVVNMKTGEHGLHAVQLTIINPQNAEPWTFPALVDYGPDNYVTEPTIVQILGQEQIRKLHVELAELLEE